ncbi:MAG: hypothetical protein IJ091_10455 [Oscillospiraceae bacterium]|nr:hypothetical protein [Oscillospiraceae bacterium]
MAKLNNTLTLNIPEGFRDLTDEEIKGKYLGAPPQWCVSDPQRHMILTAGWKKINRFSALLLSGKDLEKQLEKAILDAMDPYGVSFGEHTNVPIGTEKAEGFTCQYTAEGIKMISESLVVLYEKTAYYLFAYVRAEREEDCLALFHEVLKEGIFE